MLGTQGMARPVGIEATPHPGRRLMDWTRWAVVASPFVALFGVAVGAPIYAKEISETAGSAQFTVATVTALATLVLLSLGLVSLYLRQEHAMGAFGTVAFLLAQVGTILAAGGAWDQVFTVPFLAEQAPAVLDEGSSGMVLAGFLISFAVLVLGWLLFAVASYRAHVLPRRWCVFLMFGAALAIVPAPTALRLLFLAIGAALLARSSMTASASSTGTERS